MKKEQRAAVKRNFAMRMQALDKRGRSYNDSHPEHVNGEVFYRNMKEPEYAELPLATKRRGTVAYTATGLTYEKAHKDKETFPVFVNTVELRRLRIKYE